MRQLIKISLLLVLLNVSAAGNAAGGDTVRLTMSQVIRMAQESSPQAVQARNTFESAWLSYRSYRASMLPTLSLSSSPSLNHSTNYVTLPDGTEQYAQSNSMRNNLSLDLSQNVWFTGGTISLSGSLSRLDQLGDNPTHSYYSQPLQLSFSQSLNGYNSFKWSRKTEPIEYRRARKQYAETMELVCNGVLQSGIGPDGAGDSPAQPCRYRHTLHLRTGPIQYRYNNRERTAPAGIEQAEQRDQHNVIADVVR